ncbi:hypothetical protein [Haloarchaeobius sp. DYHT-AS-18]
MNERSDVNAKTSDPESDGGHMSERSEFLRVRRAAGPEVVA